MKKFLKITGVTVLLLVLILVAVPYLFKDKIETLIKQEGNKMLNAEFDFGNLDISLIDNFPLASLTIEDFYLKGVEEFANDTLVSAKEITAAVNVMSLFGDEGYDIKKILLDNVSLKAVVSSDGKVNWDVMKMASDSVEIVEENDTTSSPFRIKLQELEISDFNLVYDDKQGNMYARLMNMDATCAGDFGSEHTMLNLNTAVESLTFSMDGVPFLKNVNLAADLDVDADLVNNKFTLKENLIQLNVIKTAIDGWVALTDNGMDMDLKLNSNKIGFKDILSLIPAIYSKDFEGLKTDGVATLSAYAKGSLVAGSVYPEFNVDLNVANAMFQYPSLPAGVNNINVTAKVTNPGGSLDNTVVRVNPCNFVMAGNPFNLSVELQTPMSDMQFNASAKGKLDLGKVKDIYPIEDMMLNGVINADMKVNGRMSYIEKEQYDKISASGDVSLSGMKLDIKGMPNIDIKHSNLAFTPRYLQLSETTVNIGENDITLDSKFENYLGYVLKGTMLKGNLNVRSNHFNLNDFMTADTTAATVTAEEEVAVADSTVSTGISIPENIDFDMQANFKEIMLDKMMFKNVKGSLIVKNGKVDMKNLSLNTMGGEIVVNGYYNAPQDLQPEFNAALKLDRIVFAQAYKELDMVQKLAPIFNGLTGSFSGNMNINTKLDNTMSPVLQSINGSGALSTKDVSLNNVGFIQQVADIVKKPSLKDTSVKDLKIEFTISNGRVSTKPFDIVIEDYKMRLSGSTGLDQTIDYKGEITIPTSVGKVSQLGTVDMTIGGTFTSPKVGIDMASLAKKAASKAAESALDKLLGGKENTAEQSDSTNSNKDVKEKAKDAAKDAVKNALKKLF